MRSTDSAVVVLSSAIAAAMVVMGPVPCSASEVRIEHDAKDVVGFDLHGVEGFAVDVPVEVPPVSVAASGILPLPVLLPVGTRLRLTTIAPQPGDGPPLRDDASSVTLAPQGDSEAVTLTKDGQKLEGRVVGFDREAYVLSVRGVGRVRVRQRDVRSLELREPGHPGMAVVGGLAGLTGGLVTTLLVCVTADLSCSSGTAWLGMLVGAGLGGAAAGGGSWRPVPLFGDPDSVSLTLAPQRRGVAVELAVKF